jgi:hypothetical protein
VRSSPVAWPATATATTTALTGQSAENNESPDSTPNAVSIGCRRTYDGGAGGGAAAGAGIGERSSVIVMSRGYGAARDRSRPIANSGLTSLFRSRYHAVTLPWTATVRCRDTIERPVIGGLIVDVTGGQHSVQGTAAS